jgi:hypothetical protein
MYNYNYYNEESTFRKVMNFIWNVLTILSLLGVVVVITVFLLVFNDPNVFFNPFRPQPLPSPVAFPTATVTPRSILPATWTPVPTLTATLTFTPLPTNTPAPTETPFSLNTPTNTPTVAGVVGMPFEVSPGTPVGMSSVAFKSEEGCDWMGVAGQVFDLSGAPIQGLVVRIGGFLDGKTMDQTTLTGMATAYGTTGFYEFVLGEVPLASNGSLWVQLLDQAGIAMSSKVFFETYDTCDKNLLLINFKQVR